MNSNPNRSQYDISKKKDPSSNKQNEQNEQNDDNKRMAQALIGPSGGSLTLGEASVKIPEGALTEERKIEIEIVDDEIPAAFTPYSHVYRFSPHGLTFEKPVQVTLPFDGPDGTSTILWTSKENSAFMAIESTVANKRMTAASIGSVGSIGCQ